MAIIAIDPGSDQSAFVIWDGISIIDKEICDNLHMLNLLRSHSEGRAIEKGIPKGNKLVIEQVRSYGMAVGATVFDTVFWSGRFAEAWSPRDLEMMPRMDVKMHLCHSSRAKDPNISQALKDRFEPDLQPRKRPSGILKGLSKDMWAAMALAVTWWDINSK